MNDAPSTIAANPIIHDSSDNQYCLNGPGCSEDRQINDGTGSNNGRLGTQRNLTGTGMVHADTGRFISYFPPNINADGTQSRIPQADLSTGRVNMAEYLQWLRSNGYDLGNLQAR